ncbi:LPXTG cell wall anchor domain-containing protein [Microbacterium sp.]|uniref:LPXTG cell wall anchor domain-containing protein n=1 Tax=Microbacterium sp. TaxID=51671 RepID=UPI003F710D19
MRRIVLAATLAAGLVFAGSAAAMAVEGGESADPTPSSSDGYTPVDPTEPTLAGSAWASCVNDAPYINYDITLVDPDDKATSHTAKLVMSGSGQTLELDLGEVASNGTLTGSKLWPGATVENGVGAGWPGWELKNGEWVETDANFAWTRGNITAEIQVNPELTVKLAYPPSTPLCSTGPVSSSSDGNVLGLALPATGMNSVVLPIGIAAGAVMLVGVTFLLVQRRRSRA